MARSWSRAVSTTIHDDAPGLPSITRSYQALRHEASHRAGQKHKEIRAGLRRDALAQF